MSFFCSRRFVEVRLQSFRSELTPLTYIHVGNVPYLSLALSTIAFLCENRANNVQIWQNRSYRVVHVVGAVLPDLDIMARCQNMQGLTRRSI